MRRPRTSAATMIATATSAIISLEGNENLSKIIALVAVAIIVAALVRGRRKSTMIG